MSSFGAIAFLSSKNLISDRVRFLITVSGVGLAVALILLLRGIANGALSQATTVVDNSSAQVFVMQKGAENLYQAMSLLPRGTGEVIKDTYGVKRVEGVMLGGSSFQTAKGNQGRFFFLGLDPTSLEGKSWPIIKGRRWQTSSEIVVDYVLAKRMKIKMGDTLKVRDSDFTVVGFTTGGSTPFGSFVFLTEEGAAKIYRLQNVVGYFQVFLEDQAVIDNVILEIKRRVPDVEVYTHKQFWRNHRRMVENSIIPPLQVMATISFFVGVVVIGLTLYTSTIEKRREYGIMKAIGATNSNLYQLVFWQAVIAALVGFWLGVLATLFIRQLIVFSTPEVKVVVSWPLLLFVFWVASAMSFLAVFIPVKLISKIDPAIAFKE